MGKYAEQFGKDKRYINFSRQALKFAKRMSSKFWRRQGKKLLDDAPVRKQYSGWLG
jgi:hypothetical protein